MTDLYTNQADLPEEPNFVSDRYALEPDNASRGLSIGGLLAWLIVLGLCTFLIASIAYQQFFSLSKIGGDGSRAELFQTETQIRAVVAQNNLDQVFPMAGNPETDVPAQLDSGSYEQRLCYATAVGEVEGPAAALEYLQELDQKVVEHDLEVTETQQRMRNTLGELYQQYEAGDMDASQLETSRTQELIDKLGFCGEIALLPSGTPNKQQRDELISTTVNRFFAAGILMILGLLAMLFGFLVAAVLFVMLVIGKLKSGLANSETNHNWYIQTFALWLVIFIGSSIVLDLLIADPLNQLIAQPFVFFGSLVCLAWPVLRGASWSEVFSDVGWKSEQPVMDVLLSPLTYLATLPMLIPGFVLVIIGASFTSLLQPTHEFSRQAAPGHPIQEFIAEGNPIAIALIFITACIGAPVVEETVFRGVLYRHLRDVSAAWRIGLSVAFATIVNSFLFAAIHPQGMIAVPVLMTLAICFTLVREWRGNLVAPMMMHGIHNTLITCFSLLVL